MKQTHDHGLGSRDVMSPKNNYAYFSMSSENIAFSYLLVDPSLKYLIILLTDPSLIKYSW